MKKIILIVFVIALIFCACAAPAQTVVESSEQQATEPEQESAPAFDLDSYKSAVDQFRKDVLKNTISIGNMAKYEMNFMETMTKISGSIDSDETVEIAYSWLKAESGATAADVESANEMIREEYAALIGMEIEGKEAEELDSYVHSMYENYNELYKAATTAQPASFESFVTRCHEALTGITTADDNISLFCGEIEP